MNILAMVVVWQSMLLTSITFSETLNAACSVEDQKGICIPIRDCPSLFKLFQEGGTLTAATIEYLRRFQCGFQSSHPLVCCNSSTVKFPPEASDAAPKDVRSHRNFGLLNISCGKTGSVAIRIINGERADIYEFPWMARLKIRSWKGDRFTCGGTLINNRYVLTAAHCIPKNNQSSLVSVSLGYHEIPSEDSCEQTEDGEVCIPPPQNINVQDVIVHPQYSQNGSFSNDIALVRLTWSANLTTDTVKPICLPLELSKQSQDLEGLWMTVAGWGQTTNESESHDLLHVSVPVVSTTKCQDEWQMHGSTVSTHQLCAGDSTLIRGSCRGDSGGPFMTAGRINSELRMVQYGIISYGPGSCTNTAVPVVYTRVGHYMLWILNTLRP